MNSRFKYLLAGLGLIAILIFSAIASFPDQKLHLIFCDVGQGDAVLIMKGKNQILVDGGPGEKVLGCLSKHLPFWDRTLELVVVTHPEADHAAGLPSVIERYNVRQLLANSLAVDSGLFEQIRNEVLQKTIPVYSPQAGDKIKIGDLELEVLYPLQKLGNEIVWQKSDSPQVLGLTNYTGNLNETAIVSELAYGQFKTLLTGDIGADQEKQIAPELEKVSILKIAHHGSKYSSSEEFLKLVSPQLAIISVGANNSYHHPATETLSRLNQLAIKILRTDLNGEVEIVSDGQSWYTRSQ